MTAVAIFLKASLTLSVPLITSFIAEEVPIVFVKSSTFCFDKSNANAVSSISLFTCLSATSKFQQLCMPQNILIAIYLNYQNLAVLKYWLFHLILMQFLEDY